MNENLYAPPKSEVVDPAPVATETELPFFEVSTVKLVVMSLCTLGLYQLYWFYRQWKLIQERSEPDIIPWARAFFGIFWCYRCLEFIRNEGRRLGIESGIPAGPITVIWIAASLSSRLPAPYALLSLLAPLVLIPAQRRISEINTLVSPGHDKNERFSIWNWAAVVVGGGFWIFVLAGLLIQLSTPA